NRSSTPDIGCTVTQSGSRQSADAVTTSQVRVAPPSLPMVTTCVSVWATSSVEANDEGATVSSGAAGSTATGRYAPTTAGPSDPWRASVTRSMAPNNQSSRISPCTSTVISRV